MPVMVFFYIGLFCTAVASIVALSDLVRFRNGRGLDFLPLIGYAYLSGLTLHPAVSGGWGSVFLVMLLVYIVTYGILGKRRTNKQARKTNHIT